MQDIDTNETYLQSAASCVSPEEVNFPYPKLFVAYNKQPSLVFGIKRNKMLCESGRLRNRVNSRMEIRFIVHASIPGGGAENALKHHQTERDHATKDPFLDTEYCFSCNVTETVGISFCASASSVVSGCS